MSTKVKLDILVATAVFVGAALLVFSGREDLSPGRAHESFAAGKLRDLHKCLSSWESAHHAFPTDPSLAGCALPSEANGYIFLYRVRLREHGAASAFTATARPIHFGDDKCCGKLSFLVDETGAIYMTRENRDAADRDQRID